MLATGATNGQIAAALFVSESTVKSHVKRILHKFRPSTGPRRSTATRS